MIGVAWVPPGGCSWNLAHAHAASRESAYGRLACAVSCPRPHARTPTRPTGTTGGDTTGARARPSAGAVLSLVRCCAGCRWDCRFCLAALPIGSKPESTTNKPSVFQGRCRGGVDLQVIDHVPVNAVILPARQTGFPIATRPLSCFQHVKRSKQTDETDIEPRQQGAILLCLVRPDHDFVDNEIVAVFGHRRDGVAHALHGAFKDGTGPDGGGRFAMIQRR